SDEDISATELRELLAETLPDYMIPAYFLRLDEIPLSANGKVRRDALPGVEEAALKNTYIAPRSHLEKQLCALWADILGLEKNTVGIDNDFFELGGHSLKATILITKIQKMFGVRLSLGEVFSQSTVRGLATFMDSAVKDAGVPMVAVEKREYYVMSSAQKRMYILSQLDKESVSYNMPAVMLIEGAVDRDKLEKVIATLLKRQESLRIRFVTVDGETVQKLDTMENLSFNLQYEELENVDTAEILEGGGYLSVLNRFTRPFELSKAPLFRVKLVKMEAEKHLLLVDLHHIIGDGMSTGVLIRDFTDLYGGEQLEPLNIQYKDYAIWQQELIQSGELARQEEYWLNRFGGDIVVLNLPLDFPRPARQSFEGRWLDFEIPAESSQTLKTLAKEQEVTLYMVMLAALNVLLHKLTGMETIVVGSAVAGRSHPGLENIIGVFLNTLAMKNTVSAGITFADLLGQVGENALQAYDNQDYGFDDLVEKLELKRDYSRNPLFDVMFNFQNMDFPEIAAGNLTFSSLPREGNAVKLDLKLMAQEIDNRICCSVDYPTKLFKEETMKTFTENYLKIINIIIENPTIKISKIQLLSKQAKQELVTDFSEDLEMDF
ncbi:MAG: non-ribosomal peptide synthetase, partial [bacterium]|nr:non-ribosomal peptide synthetase [bacterium]